MEQSKYPKTTFSQLQRYLGEDYSEELVEQLRKERFVTNEIKDDGRGFVGWAIHRKDKDGVNVEEILFTEELLAMLMKYGKMLSER